MNWPWQVPGASFFAVDGAYELAYAAPARARAGIERNGQVSYLIAAYVRGITQGEGPLSTVTLPKRQTED